jgi:hypothetical protein
MNANMHLNLHTHAHTQTVVATCCPYFIIFILNMVMRKIMYMIQISSGKCNEMFYFGRRFRTWQQKDELLRNFSFHTAELPKYGSHVSIIYEWFKFKWQQDIFKKKTLAFLLLSIILIICPILCYYFWFSLFIIFINTVES